MNSIHTLKSTINSAMLLLLGLVIFSTTGCMAGLGLAGKTLPAEPISADSAGIYQVQMSGNFSKPTVYQGEIDGPLTVQDALERSGATDKFRGMDIMVYRQVEETGRGLKMPVEYKSRSKSVTPEQNYALHPNDRILVESRSRSAIDKVVDSLNQNSY